jgi:hypothetical protein
LENLEVRIVPATYDDYWYGTVSNDWSTAANWTTDQGQHVVPDKNADVVFGITGITNRDCTMNVAGGTTINSLTIAISYNNRTLTLNTSLTIQDNGDGKSTGFGMSLANIAQPNGAASAINCYGVFDWTSGTIGSQTKGASNLCIGSARTGTLPSRE